MYFYQYFNRKVLDGFTGFSLIFLDIDRFGIINDIYGHSVGDNVLKDIGSFLLKNYPKERVFRYGGEEFIIVSLSTNDDTILREAEKIRLSLTLSEEYSNLKEFASIFSISLGIAKNPNSIIDLKKTVTNAEKATRFSKLKGGNRSTIYTNKVNQSIDNISEILSKNMI